MKLDPITEYILEYSDPHDKDWKDPRKDAASISNWEAPKCKAMHLKYRRDRRKITQIKDHLVLRIMRAENEILYWRSSICEVSEVDFKEAQQELKNANTKKQKETAKYHIWFFKTMIEADENKIKKLQKKIIKLKQQLKEREQKKRQ